MELVEDVFSLKNSAQAIDQGHNAENWMPFMTTDSAEGRVPDAIRCDLKRNVSNSKGS